MDEGISQRSKQKKSMITRVPSTLFHCRYDVLRVISTVGFLPKLALAPRPKKYPRNLLAHHTSIKISFVQFPGDGYPVNSFSELTYGSPQLHNDPWTLGCFSD